MAEKARRPGAVALLLTALLLCRPGFADTALTFSQAWERVLAEDHALAAELAGQDQAQALMESARSLLLPRVELVGSYTRLDKPVELDALAMKPLDSLGDSLPGQLLIQLLGGQDAFMTPVTRRDITSSSLVAFWPLYTGGKISATRRTLQLGRREAAALYEEVRRARFLELVSTYYGLVTAEKLVLTQEQAESTLAHHLRAAEALQRHAQIAEVERLAARSAYDQARIAARDARAKRDTARMVLTSLVHADSPVTTRSRLFTNAALPPRQELLDGLADHPSLRVLALKKEQAGTLGEAARGAYHPEVFLFGGYSVYEDDSLASDLTPDWLVGLGVRLPLLDRSGRAGKIRAADSAEEQARQLYQGAQRILSVLLETQYREADNARRTYQDLVSNVLLAEKTLHLRQRAFEEGLGRALDVVDAQTALTAARTRRDAAAFRYVVALAQILALSGRQEQFFLYQKKERKQEHQQQEDAS